MKKIIAILTISLAALAVCRAESSDTKRFPQQNAPEGFSTFRMNLGAYFNGKRVYSMRDALICETKGKILDIDIDPTGTFLAVVWQTRRSGRLSIYDPYKQYAFLAEPRLKFSPVLVSYSADSKNLFLMDSDGCAHIMDASNLKKEGVSIAFDFASERFVPSPDGKFIASSNGEKLQIRNVADGTLRKDIEAGTRITDFKFSPDGSAFLVLSADGRLVEYDTVSFLPGEEIGLLGVARSLTVHPDGKYVAVVTADNVIAVVNRLDPQDRDYIPEEEGAVDNLIFPAQNDSWISYSSAHSLVYTRLVSLFPNYTKLIADEVQMKMDEWMKMMPGETLEEYGARVNEETKAKQLMLFEEEVATHLAEGRLEAAQISLGSYSAEDQMLSLNFDSMPSIFLSVPQDKLSSFSDVSELGFRNARYGVKKDDKFELVYVEVFNKRTGASFIFDNRERKSLEYLRTSDNFVPIDLVRMSNMEEIRLEEIKDNIVETARNSKRISNHTNIAVSTKVEKTQDETGRKILNYNVGFSYDVAKGFSASEDFAAGKYRIDDSPAAQAMVSIIKDAFDGEFAQYVKQGRRVKVSITGMADNLRINKTLGYDGSCGEYVDQPVFGQAPSVITVTKETGISENDQLAFIRSAGVRQAIEEGVPALSKANTEFEHHIALSAEEGGAFRRISVMFTFYDAF